MVAWLRIVSVFHAGGHTARTYRLLILTLLLRPFGNLSLAWGIHHFPRLLAWQPLPYLEALLNPFVALGIAMLILALLTRMALLSVADLSFVLPLTATGYIITALLGKVFLGEDVGSNRWLGTCMIFAGVVLVGSTPERSEAPVQGR
jgi:drug/metabolite transporter (DMT)-like permease